MVRGCVFCLLLLMIASPVMAVAPGGVYAPDRAGIRLTMDPFPMPRTVGYHITRGTVIYRGRKFRFSCGVFLPPAFLNASQPMPVVMMLHNRFAIGYDGGGEIVGEGMGRMLVQDGLDMRAEGQRAKDPINLRKDAQFIGLVPQCPEGFTWEAPAMADILCKFIAQVVAAYHADDDRVYLTGFSYGASSSWRVALNAPDRFAAIICCDGRATPDPIHDVQKLKNVAVYLEVGQWDGDFVKETDWMHQALNNSDHRNFIYRMIPGGNHFNYEAVYLDPQVWKWIFAQKRIHAVPTTQADRSAAEAR